VGEVSFHRLDRETLTAELNIKVLASERGHGHGRRALHRFLEYFFNEFGGLVMTDNIAPGNTQGQALLAAAGFRRVTWPDWAVRFEMTVGEFRARNFPTPAR
jgi:RimJ/RimL family protein N-acetyltransferase